MHEMKMYLNGNMVARPAVERGVSLAHRTKLTKSQRAALAAEILDGRRIYQPTRVDLATLMDVSAPMIVAAQRLSPAARQMIIKGVAALSDFAPRRRNASPKFNLRDSTCDADFVTALEAAE
jgi:hypothetical protein